MFYVILSA